MEYITQEERVREVILYIKFLEAVRIKFFELQNIDGSMKKLIWNKVSRKRKSGDPIGGNNTSKTWQHFKLEIASKQDFSDEDVSILVSKIRSRLVA